MESLVARLMAKEGPRVLVGQGDATRLQPRTARETATRDCDRRLHDVALSLRG